MRRTLTRFLAVLAALAVVGASACGGSGERGEGSRERRESKFECPPRAREKPPNAVVVTLFHETHTHGNLVGTPDGPRDVTFARYVGLRNAVRSCLAEPANTLFLGNGDDLSPDLDGVVTDGRHTVDAFNAAGVDANTFGFSELNEDAPPTEESLARLREHVAASRFTWVSGNVREGRKPNEVFAFEQGARRWIIEDVGGVRVGLTGLLSTSPTREGDPPAVPPEIESSLRILDPVQAMRGVVPQMRAAGAEVVVVLSHMIHEDTLRVVRSVKGIDVALGTHLGRPTAQPQVVDGAIVAVAGPDEMQALGQLDLAIRRGRIVDHTFQRHIPSPSDPADTGVEDALAKYLEK